VCEKALVKSKFGAKTIAMTRARRWRWLAVAASCGSLVSTITMLACSDRDEGDGAPSAVAVGDASLDADADGALDAQADADAGDAGVSVAANPIVISQVYAGGGEGAPFHRGFVVLLNRSNEKLPLQSMSLQVGEAEADFGAPQADGGPSTKIFVFPRAFIEPRQYLLIGLGTASDAGTALPTTDFEAPQLTLGATSGKIALARRSGALKCGGAMRCTPSKIFDMVGYGAASDYEGHPVPALSGTKAAFRNEEGCDDDEDNEADFTLGPPAPLDHTATHDCSVKKVDAGDAAPPKDASPDSRAPANPPVVEEEPPSDGPPTRPKTPTDAGKRDYTDGWTESPGCSMGPANTFSPAALLGAACGLAFARRRRRK
jgi:hypothetical protein